MLKNGLRNYVKNGNNENNKLFKFYENWDNFRTGLSDFLDSAPIIYYVESNPNYCLIIDKVFNYIESHWFAMPRATKMVIEWASIYQTELLQIWNTQEFRKLPPLK